MNKGNRSMKSLRMKSIRLMSAIAAVSAMLVAPTGYALEAAAQQPPAAPPAGAQQPPATPPPTAPPAAVPPSPRPFPEGAKVAYVDMQAIATNSVEGKSATSKLDAFRKKTSDSLLAKNTALKAQQDKLTSGGSVMNDQARAQLEKEIEKGQRELQFAQEDAQRDLTEMQTQLTGEFQEKLNPVVEQVRAEKGLLMILSVRDSGIVAVDLGLDLSAEVVRRFDAMAKNPPPPKKQP
jgi:Skp family chaperone for outer membrane proteins